MLYPNPLSVLQGATTRTQAFTHVLIAATLNHVRRTLLPFPTPVPMPWLGLIWLAPYKPDPLEDLRLALGHAEVFAERMLGAGPLLAADARAGWAWAWAVLCGCAVNWAWGLGGRWLGKRVRAVGYCCGRTRAGGDQKMGLVGEGGGRRRVSEGKQGGHALGCDGEQSGMVDVISIGYLVWILGTVEYLFASGVYSTACIVVCSRLAVSRGAEYAPLASWVTDHWARVVLVACQLAYYSTLELWPLLCHGYRRSIRGQPGLLLLLGAGIGGITGLLRYRSTFYIALELSGLFVWSGYLLVVFGLLVRVDRNACGLNRGRVGRVENLRSSR